jgi:hypothetical protein
LILNYYKVLGAKTSKAGQFRYEMLKWKGTKMKNNAHRENRENTNEKIIHWTSGMKEVTTQQLQRIHNIMEGQKWKVITRTKECIKMGSSVLP